MPKRSPSEGYSEQSSPTGWFVAIIVVIALLAVGYLVVAAQPPAQAAPPQATAFVKIIDDGGHGSGVHIGNGYIVTAAHVANDFKDMTVVDTLGVKRTAKTLWQNVGEDVALMRVEDFGALAVADLDCAPSPVGQSISAIGNPRDLDNITMSGLVAGATTKIGQWAHGLPVDMTILPGMSGGGVINDAGDVIGISVGAMNLGTSAIDVDSVSLGVVVPSATICALMART